MSALRKLIPLGDRVLVKRVQAASQTLGGVFLPENASKKENEGEIIAVGPGGRTSDGKLIPMQCAIGDKVLLPEYGGSSLKVGDEDLQLFRDEDILAKFQ